MYQKGPGEGHRAAKDACLALKPQAVCEVSGRGGIRHYRISVDGHDVGCAAASARAAWNRFHDRLLRAAEDKGESDAMAPAP